MQLERTVIKQVKSALFSHCYKSTNAFPPAHHLKAKMKILIVLLFALIQSVQAASWDARTTRTNTTVTDSDIQAALSRGITPAFVAAFPNQSFGIYVLVDRHVAREINADITYLSLGICKRLPGNEYSLPMGQYSDMVTVPSGTPNDQQRQLVLEKLAVAASTFSQGMMQSKAILGKGTTPFASGR